MAWITRSGALRSFASPYAQRSAAIAPLEPSKPTTTVCDIRLIVLGNVSAARLMLVHVCSPSESDLEGEGWFYSAQDAPRDLGRRNPDQRFAVAAWPRLDAKTFEPFQLGWLIDETGLACHKNAPTLAHGLVDAVDLEVATEPSAAPSPPSTGVRRKMSPSTKPKFTGRATGPSTLMNTKRPTPPSARWAAHCSLLNTSSRGRERARPQSGGRLRSPPDEVGRCRFERGG